MHVKPSRADLHRCLIHCIHSFVFLCICIRKSSVFTLLFDDFETMTGKIIKTVRQIQKNTAIFWVVKSSYHHIFFVKSKHYILK